MAYIENHKKELREIQLNEQDLLLAEYRKNQKVFPYTTANSCMECHSKQTDFWQGTAHSLAYITLKKAKEETNMSCVQCHALGVNSPKGFSHSKNIIKFNPDEIRGKAIPFQMKKYWKTFNKSISLPKSVRETAPAVRKVAAKKWMEIDGNLKVSHNFANVQCLNCHVKSNDHPFDTNEKKLTSDQKYTQMKNACITCHTADQSPEWYQKNSKGLATNKLNEVALLAKMKKIACPKENE